MDISGVFAKVKNANSLSTSNSKAEVSKTEKPELSELLSKSNGKQIEVKGEIVNVTSKQVSIKVGDQIIQGNMNVEGKLNIGDLRNFLLEVENGKIKLMLVPESAETLKDQHLENVLKELGELSKENLKFAKALLDSNLPVNKDTLTALKRSMALFGKADESALDKSMLMLKNDLPVNLKNTENVNNILDRQQNVTKNLENIDSLVSQLGDDPIAQELKQILSDIDTTVENPDKLLKGETKNLDNLNDVAKLVAENVLDDEAQTLTQNKEVAIKDDTVKALKDLLKSVSSQDGQDNVSNSKALQNPNVDMENDEAQTIKNLLDKLQNKEASSNQNTAETPESSDNVKQQNSLPDSDKDVTNTLLKHLNKQEGEENLEKALSKNFGVDENISTPKELEKHINDKLDKLDRALELLKNTPNSEKNAEVLKHIEKEITTIKDKLTFASEIKDNVFIQIPFTLNNKSTNGELVVFKDKRSKRQNKNYTSALVSLDTANLGLFEAYVVKKQSKIDIQFRFVNDFVKGLVQTNTSKLDGMLKSKSVSINSLSFKKIDEPFSIIQEEPHIKTVEVASSDSAFKFDVRG